MKILLLILVLALGCRPEPHISTHELKTWTSDIERRVQTLEDSPDRYQLVAATAVLDGKPMPTVFRIDSATGDTFYFRSHSLEVSAQDGTTFQHSVEGWWPVSTFSESAERARKTGSGFKTAPTPVK